MGSWKKQVARMTDFPTCHLLLPTIPVIAVPACSIVSAGIIFTCITVQIQFMEPFEIPFEYNNRKCTAMVEKIESPAVQYVVYFKDEELDLKYGQLIYEIKSGQLMNTDEKTLEGADLIAQIGLELKNYLQDNRIPVE